MSHCCRICGRDLPNEKFNSKGHLIHVCKDCMEDRRAQRKENREANLKRKEEFVICNGNPSPDIDINTEIVAYVSENIIPRYAVFDKAHRENHVKMVIERSLELATHFSTINRDMVYVIAAYHDLGMINGRENHHIDSGIILRNDAFLKSYFSRKQMKTMAEAVEDHRASSGVMPRSIYGKIVAEADRLIEPETIIRRTIQFGLTNYPELDKTGHYLRTIDHLKKKYGSKGYLKICLPWSDNAKRLEDLRQILRDEIKVKEIFDRIYKEEIIGLPSSSDCVMNKPLTEMTLGELWQLFPIMLSEHRPIWGNWAKEEIAYLSNICHGFHPIINHIGSTAIPGIVAKPIIDILVELEEGIDYSIVKDTLESEGYICMSYSDSRISFNKGYTPSGYADKVFHIHVHRQGDKDEIIFRDYLLSHPEIAKKYEDLKLSLLSKFRHDRDSYTEAKSEFVRNVIQSAKQK